MPVCMVKNLSVTLVALSGAMHWDVFAYLGDKRQLVEAVQVQPYTYLISCRDVIMYHVHHGNVKFQPLVFGA